MNARNLICLVVDGLHAGMIGAYGNSWIRSEALDHFASQSFLFDQAFVERPMLDAIYYALWHAAALTNTSERAQPCLASIMATRGLATTLVTDEPRVADLPGATDFNERVLVEQPSTASATQVASKTNMARLFAAAMRQIETLREPFCLWIHARGLMGPWDAPYDFRQRFADEDDPPPPSFVDVPNRLLPVKYDPDELLGVVHAYAGQITLLDQQIDSLMQRLDESPVARTTQVTIMAARGFPLGEHRRIGLCDHALFNELTQITWLMRFPDQLGCLDRNSSLVVPGDLPGTLLDALGIDTGELPGAHSLLPLIGGKQSAIRDRVYMSSQNERALRTSAWLLREPAEGPTELYTKPSDRWEVNDVAKLCTDIASGMEAALAESAESHGDKSLSTLAPALTTEVD